MRMHPRRRGTYSACSKLASIIVNEHYKNKKKQQRYNSPKINVPINETKQTDENGCLALFSIVFFVLIIIIAVELSF